MHPRLQAVRRTGRRLLVIVLLAVTLSAATYAVAVSPLGPPVTALLRALPGAPQPPPPRIANAPAAQPSAPRSGAPPGAGRGPSLARGLPELGRHIAVVGATVAAFALGRRWRPRRRGPYSRVGGTVLR
ncbi:MAG TPA: hypothetical protein VKZ60_16580 [Chloroflexota bacterium]|nr:hypothetical protein [Chloroflexota bacterium]